MGIFDGIKIIEKGFEFFTFLIGRRDKNKRKQPSNIFHDSNHIDRITHEIIESGLAVDCFFLVLAHNGGKKLSPVTLKYRSIMGGAYNEVQMKNFDISNYKNLPVDFDYNEHLSSIYEDRRRQHGIDIGVEFASEKLRDIYLFENLKYCRYHFLHYSDEGMWFALIGTTQDGENFNDTRHKQQIYFSVTKIKNIIKKY